MKKIDSLSAPKKDGAPQESPEEKPTSEETKEAPTKDTDAPAEAEAEVDETTEVAPEQKTTDEKPVEEAAQVEASTSGSEQPAEGATPEDNIATDQPAETAAQPESFDSLFSDPSTMIGKPPSWLWWLILLVVSVVIGVVGYALAQHRIADWLSVTPTPTTSVTATPISSATPTASATVTPSPTPSPTTVLPSSVTLRVLNGTAVAGAASKAQTILQKAGFTVRTIGNAKSTTFATTTIFYQTGRKAEAQLVQAALTTYQTTIQESSADANPDMVLVVVGKK